MTELVRRGEIWDVDLDPVVGHEQGGRRPALVVSTDYLHTIPSELVTILPLTTRNRGIRAHVHLVPPEGGLNVSSVILTEQIRTVSRLRLRKRRGAVSTETMAAVDERLRYFLNV
jgi:mRNA interferase MazF